MNDQQVGLYKKYNVERIGDTEGKHSECEMFVLDLVHDRHAPVALAAYAESCRRDYRDLSDDLRELVRFYA